MYTQPIYQGRLQRPDLAGRTVMTNYGQHVMQGASQGGVPFRQVQAAPVANGPAWNNNAPTAEEQMNSAMRAYGATGSGPVQIQQVNSNFQNNRNPELMGGVAEVEVNGQRLRVPNALLQQFMFNDAWNAGRSNSVQEFFGGGQQPANMPYSNLDATQQRFDRTLQQNPQYTQQGELNPYKRALSNSQEANNQYGQAVMLGQNQTERRDARGVLIGGDALQKQQATELARRNREQAEAEAQRYSTRGARRLAQEGASNMGNEMMRQFEPVRSTYSNVKIRETLV